mmetsp:Transcript_24509/g.38016  ORF Transcript_24509/g.38016 Transcript_24509/m.38016 type:complete len:224 (+) Transcript_24509:1545-2216(+)
MPIYLEYAPVGLLEDAVAHEDSDDEKAEEDGSGEKTVFVKNLNYSTNEAMLEAVFKGANLTINSVKIVRRPDNQQSKGFGFVELASPEVAKKAIKKLQNFMLEDHALKLSLVEKKGSIDDMEAARKKDKVLKKREREVTELDDGDEVKSNKLIVKNLAFEATADDIRELFKQYGALKKVRLPKKVNSQRHRGFGFVEFTTPEQAQKAFKSLQHSHLYGRKIVI